MLWRFQIRPLLSLLEAVTSNASSGEKSTDLEPTMVPIPWDIPPILRSSLMWSLDHSHGCFMSHRIHGAGIHANIWGILMVNVSIYTIHGSYGCCFKVSSCCYPWRIDQTQNHWKAPIKSQKVTKQRTFRGNPWGFPFGHDHPKWWLTCP